LSDVAVDADNNIFAVGAVSQASPRDAASRTPIDGPSVAELVKYDADGNFIDNVGFGSTDTSNEFNALTIDDQGRIVAVGDDGSDYLVARYKNDLSFDSSFGEGPVTTDFTPIDSDSFPFFDTALGVRVLEDGHIVVGGASEEEILTRGLSGENAQPSAARYLGDQEPSNPFDIEEFVDVDDPNEDLTNHLQNLSTSALLYITTVPDADGNVTIDLGDGGDNVSLTTITAADGTKQIAVTVNGITLFFDADGTNSIKINGNAGPDKIISDSSVKTTLIVAAGSGDDSVTGGGGRNLLFGQSGNDTLNGGSKGDVVVGGSGSDKCFGNDGNDIVIGGPNNDSVNGGNGEDIVIAGSTIYDSDTSALSALLDEWTSSNSNSSRIGNIRNGTGANAPFYLAGASVPTAQRTVFDDQTKDTVTGGSSRDWFFGRTNVSTKDNLTDKGGSEEFDQI
jgi:Ca2+-binding RTX toxin-like protein